ncbi:MAG: SdrD B-like domain-containing protein, partial [Kiritimatiellia bacterium]
MKRIGSTGWLRKCAGLLAGALGLGGGGSAALAQVRPVTGISAFYDAIDDPRDDYSVAGGGTATYPAGTTYQIRLNAGEQNNLIIRAFETGTNVYNFVQLAQRINIVRVDGAVTGSHNIVFFEEESIGGTNVNLKPSLVTTMIDSLRSDLVNRGADNVFANQGDGNGNNNNIERIDYVFNAGFPYYNFTDQRGFLVMDRGGNDRFKIAVILAVDTNGMPTAFSRPVSVLDTEWGSSGITLATTVMRGYTEGGEPLKPSARTSVQPLAGVFLSWDQFGLTTNDMVYGYSLAGNDVTTNGAYWTHTTNAAYFPTNTTVDSNFGGLDLISGGAMFFDEVLEVGIGDRVWEDFNGDGIQDANEPGLSNVLVHIYATGDVLAATARTDGDGAYFAQGMGPGNYVVQFFPPDGYQLSPQYARTDPDRDSDPDALTGITESYVLGSGETNLSVDAGFFLTPGDLRLGKAVSPTNVNVGETIVFTLSATNAGTPRTALIQVTDTLPAAFAFSGYGASTGTFSAATGLWDLGELAPGAGATLAITGTVSAGSGGSRVTNVAAVTRLNRPDTNLADNVAAAVFRVQAADLGVAKSADQSAVEEGEPIRFTVAVSNRGPDDVASVQINDLLPAGLTFVAAAPSQGAYTAATGVWMAGALANGAAATLVVDAVAAGGSGGLFLTNGAAIAASSHEDPDSGNNSAFAAVLVYGADVALAKTVEPPAAVEGQTVLYTVVITNPGPSEATGLLVSEPLTNGLVYVSHDVSQGAYASGSGLWTIGTLGVNAAATLRIQATVGGGTMDATITNRAAIVAADLPDPNLDNNVATAVLSVSSLTLTKISDVAVSVHPGDTITYTVVASNSGSQTHTGLTLADSVPAGTVFVPGSLTVVQTPLSATTVVYASSATFVAPAGVTSVTVEAWGGGGGGGRARGNPATGGGGAGGSYARKTLAVVPLQSYAVTVGAGGIGGNGTGTDTQHGRPGNPSWFQTTNTVFAQGGARGLSDMNDSYFNGLPGSGSDALCVGDVVYRGGHGGRGNYNSGTSYRSGAGGGGAGTAGTGGDAATNGVAGVGTALYGGDGAAGVTNNLAGANGAIGGGGGSGGKANSYTDRNGGAGADGLVRITYETTGAIADPPHLASGWTLAPGQRLEATFTVQVDDPLAVMAITNVATVASAVQPVPLTATVVDPVVQVDLSIEKTASASELEEGAGIVFTLVVANASATDGASGVAVDDPLPAGFQYVAAVPSQGAYDPGTGRWTVGSLGAGAAATLQIEAAAVAGAGGFRWTNVATLAVFDQTDPDPADNRDQVEVLVAGADVGLTKSVDNPTPNETAQVTYTIQLTNAGPSAVAALQVEEPLTNGLAYVSDAPSQGTYDPGSGTWTVGALAVGATASLTVVAAVEPGTFGTTLTNVSRIAAADLPDPAAGNDADAAEISISGLTVAKTSDVVDYATPGDVITYTIVVSNLSPVVHTGIQIDDVLPAGTIYVADSTWVAGPGTNAAAGDAPPWLATNRTLAAGETLTVTFAAEVVNPGSSTQLLNVVSVTCDQQPAPVVASVADRVRHADLGIGKTVDEAHPNEGDTVTYVLVVTNQGPTNASGIRVLEPLVAGLTYAAYVAEQGTYDSGSGIWSVGELDLGASVQLEISATVDAGTAGRTLTNRAWISGADMADLAMADNEAFAEIAVASVDVGLGKVAAPAVPAVNSRVVYTLTATNFGPDEATGVEIADLLPAGVVYLAHVAGQGTYDSGTGIWAVGSLAPLAHAALEITAVVASDAVGTVVTNVATLAAADQVDVGSGNDSAAATIQPVEALLDLTKSAVPAGPVQPGDVITYTLAINNRSGETQTGVTVTDPLPSGAAYVAESSRISAPFTVNETYGDQFSRRVYSNNDGSHPWAGDWEESEADGPTAGYIQIQFDNGVDETYTLRFTGGSQTIRRSADLSSYTSATLEFDYQRIGLDTVYEYVAIQISTNGVSDWTELDRFRGSTNDADYVRFSADISAYMAPATTIRFISPAGMDGTDVVWIDDLLITGTRRSVLTVAGGGPPTLVSGLTLEPDEDMTVVFEVWVENPALYTQIVNQAELTSAQMADPQVDTAVTPVESCVTAVPTGLHADPTNVLSFTARWTEVPSAFGYRLDVATAPDFAAPDYVAGFSNRAVSGLFQPVTGLTHNALYYFRVRAEWDVFCTSANSSTQAVLTLGLPGLAVFPEQLDFGTVDVRTSSNLVVTVTNGGSATLEITSIEFVGAGFNHYSVLPAAAQLASSNSLELVVTYAPVAGGTNAVVMVVHNDSLDNPDLEVPVQGYCFDPEAQVPELLAFLATDSAGLTNEVTDRSLGSAQALLRFTAYHYTGIAREGASFDLFRPDGSLAFSNAPLTDVEPVELDGRACQQLSAYVPRFFPAVLGIYTARVTLASSNGIWLTRETNFTAVAAGSAVPLSLDHFGRGDVADDIGEGWISNLTGPVPGNVQIRNRVLQLYGPGGSGGTNGRISVVRDLSSRYDPAWTNNAGTMTWAFNFWSGRTNQAGLAPGAYGAVFVLGADSVDWVTGAGNGYAVRICSNQVALVAFAGGLNLDSDTVVLGAPAALDPATTAVAVLVDLDVATGIWRLYVHPWGGAGLGAFGNPLDDIGDYFVTAATNDLHLHRSLPYVGCYWNHGNAAVGTNAAAYFDDLYAPYVLQESEAMRFAAIDNDIMLPTALGNVRVNEDIVPEDVPDRLEVVWTNAPDFVVTFDPLATDQDPGYSIPAIQREVRGIGEYRVSPEPVNVLSSSNRGVRGFPFPVVTTNGALANYGFEMPTDGGDWQLNAACAFQPKALAPDRVYEGTNSLRQTAGGVAYQTFEFRNASAMIPQVSFAGWHLGAAARVEIAAYATNDLEHPTQSIVVPVAAATNWTSFAAPMQALGGGDTEFLRVTLATDAGPTYWDYLNFNVDIGTNRSSMRFHAGPENQGLVPQYIYAVDADYNRGGDRLGGLTKYFYIPFDLTPPAPVAMPAGGSGATAEGVDDPTSQFDLQWSTNGLGPDNPASPLHPT